MNLDTLYQLAKTHKDEHKSCGGEPYKSYEKLFEIVSNVKSGVKGNEPLRILEIGTAVGFTTYILHNKRNFVDTIEFHQDHIDEAKKNIAMWGGDITKINFLMGDAEVILPKLKEVSPGSFDIIFFDGYGVKLFYYNFFDLLLKEGGLLITANKHLKSTENTFFEELKDISKWEYLQDFADTVVHKKIVTKLVP